MRQPGATPNALVPDALGDELPRLRAIVARVAGARHADDLVQECCVRILESGHTYRDEGAGPGRWMATIARNLSRSFLRQSGMRATSPLEEEPAMSAQENDEAERIGWILDQLGRLPEADRDVLKLRYFDALTVTDVAGELGVSQSTASERIGRALSALETRAQREGWLASFLPLPLAQMFAGATPMKTLIAGGGAAVLAAAATTPFLFTVDPATTVQGSVATLPATTFAGTVFDPLDPERNLIWCGSRKLGWDALVASAGDRFDPNAMGKVAGALHADPFSAACLDPASYVVGNALDGDDWIERTQGALIERFGQGRDPLLDELGKSGVAASYAFLAKSSPFQWFFDDLSGESHPFGSSGADVESFGVAKHDPTSVAHKSILEQATIFHYGGPEDFCIEFRPAGRDRIIVAQVAPGDSLDETWSSVRMRRRAYDRLSPEARRPLGWHGGERLVIPKLDFDLGHVFPSMETGIDGLPSLYSAQSIRVRFDHRGAEVHSLDMGMLQAAGPDEPKQLVVDGPFLVAFIEDGAPEPYLLAWIADDEVLVPRAK